MFSGVGFQYTFAIFLLLVIPLILGLFWSLYLYRNNALKTFGTLSLVQNLLTPRSKIKRTAIYLSLVFSWFFATLALMGPQGNPHYLQEEEVWQEETLSTKELPHELIFLIDTSQSMSVQDTRKSVSRLTYAQEIADTIISKSRGEVISVYAFTSELLPIVPSTFDHLFSRLMIRNLNINEGNSAGTDFQKVFNQLKKHWENDNPLKIKTIVLLSDGEDTQLEDVSPLIKGRIIKGIEKSIADLVTPNIRILTIAMGSRKGGTIPNYTHNERTVHSDVNEDILKLIAKTGDGEFFFSNDETPLGLASEVQAQIQEKKGKGKKMTPTIPDTSAGFNLGTPLYDLYFQIPLAFAILSLAISLLIPETYAPRRKK